LGIASVGGVAVDSSLAVKRSVSVGVSFMLCYSVQEDEEKSSLLIIAAYSSNDVKSQEGKGKWVWLYRRVCGSAKWLISSSFPKAHLAVERYILSIFSASLHWYKCGNQRL
jgi:hypothetical protein